MNIEQETRICGKCKNFATYCFCYCPYCGENKLKNCNCNLKISEDYKQILSNNQDLEKSFKDKLFREDYKDWWRLEKWQIGRKNFS